MAIELAAGEYFTLARNLISIPPLFSIGVWIKPAAGFDVYGGVCRSRDVDPGGLIISGYGGSPTMYVFDWTDTDWGRNTGLTFEVGVWQLLVGTAAPGAATTWLCNRKTGVVSKDVNAKSLSARSFKTWYSGVDSNDSAIRKAPGQYAMVAFEQATWSENDIRRLFRGEPIERVRPQAYVIMRNMERRRTDRGDQRLISSHALKTTPNPAFLQTVPKRPQFVFAGTSPPPPPPPSGRLIRGGSLTNGGALTHSRIAG